MQSHICDKRLVISFGRLHTLHEVGGMTESAQQKINSGPHPKESLNY